MELTEQLKQALAGADDAYLAGLSNKGTLNRGRKDLDGLEDVTAAAEKGEVTLQWKDVRCVIREPLGSSVCSCPSTAFCRHRITAVLWLKGQMETAPTEPKRQDFSELRQVPLEKLSRILGTSRLSALLFRLESGIGPEMEEGSVIQVALPWAGVSVRLLEPLEHSTCSCHSASFCVHKAEALLWWQLQKGFVKPEQIRIPKTSQELEPEQIRGICRSVRQTLAELMGWGLGRTSPEVCQTLERMASLCHTAGLPNLERSLRRLCGEYEACFARSAGFRDTVLLERLAHSHRLAEGLEKAGEADLPALAGAFREDYRSVGDLKLYLLGSRSYVEKNGYAGTVYYFWDMESLDFRSFRHIRPTFYEGKPRIPPKHAAPWGLPCTLDQVCCQALTLSGAKANRHGSLSSTSESTATLLGKLAPGLAIPEQSVCRDFRELVERSGPGRSELHRLALIRPARVEEQPYDAIRQICSLRLLDKEGRDLWVTVPYSPDNAAAIDWLEHHSKELDRDGAVFLGLLSREEDRLTCFPLECFTLWEGSQ